MVHGGNIRTVIQGGGRSMAVKWDSMESEKPGGKGVNWSLLESLAPPTQFPVKPNFSAKVGVWWWGLAGGGGREGHSCHSRTNLFHSAAHSRIPNAHLILISPLALLPHHFCKHGCKLC